MQCLCCFEDIEILVLYRDKKEGEWKKSPYCKECINYFIQNQWKDYVEKIKNETCKVSLERLIHLGPPFHIREPGLPCENERNEVYELLINGVITSSKLEGTLSGKELEDYLNELKCFSLCFSS
jgi:hypothetical protein